ncbi:TrmH family RNA methyltransferase [Gleimia hominis]|uniref:TrmH family RNA methyltransferase n=1 Tax=Gleimia hominis TaxID=595468 RepID=UPI001E4DEFC9|nr:RNA methyltransferase [Gleimia hominis]WIK65219.1 RNA methyltransferase [Gleimia hominis]
MSSTGNQSARRPAILANPNSDRIREVARLAGRSARRRAGRVLVEGPQAVREALRFCGRDLKDVYLSSTAMERDFELTQLARTKTRWVHEVTDEVSTAISKDAQGVSAVVEDFRTDGLPRVDWSFVMILAGIQDPGNVGTMIRIADAAGADAVLACSGTADVSSPKVVRASAGSVFHLPTVVNVSFEDAAQWAHARNMTVLGADGRGSTDLFDAELGGEAVDLAAPTAWVFGNEAHGFAQVETGAIDHLVAIPLAGHAESLNVSAAAAVCMFASARMRRLVGGVAGPRVGGDGAGAGGSNGA